MEAGRGAVPTASFPGLEGMGGPEGRVVEAVRGASPPGSKSPGQAL